MGRLSVSYLSTFYNLYLGLLHLQVAFRAKVGKEYQLPHKGIIPEEFGVVCCLPKALRSGFFLSRSSGLLQFHRSI